MKRVFFIHISFLVSFFILLSLVNSWLALSYWPLWLGAIIGSVLPEMDSLVYVFFVNPQELTSQRVIYFFKKGNILSAIKLLNETSAERDLLVFHSLSFILVSFVLLFWLATSSGSIFGKGIVFAMLTHLLTGDLVKKKYSVWYSLIGFGMLLVLGIMA
ncbi:hypothetical protein COX03_02380 [Candidatus Woesebacteria bacterium CG22_combo_CG10-13_8_21_14_all_39_10]|uniref:Uncharacterized protein n=4 Tax=Candidatus Woeseibacteriota TaxID=1752722 RepID=A0A2M7XA16_9BACT|nr:MAG: hypothetical protein COX03_02380 [Candidatus Woesebacteria bacterium CG22_combo_CG10-13_8_21_14_all_39_10]PIU71687.1 MAG: hypothetical protein COS80_01955 [Candidatus Woesebacteria bacterium CG06_land_8_20_14_3_00_39_27]PIZ49591.1 MAG: hypothetical protein COY29_01510 [Candidatus Woesebacteria bacterium CG_4_10_14_0_2_um_filter_39_14]PJA42851.1 MAG: hypothetical protein CO176_01255 [Candidatus Woesebacteria bacterium CG_4_9_14_3_um_filter_39_10]